MNDHSPRVLTFDYLLDLVQNDEDLNASRRANVASSIRSFLKVSGKAPQMPASFPILRLAIESIQPTQHGIDSRRWSNIKSDLRFALERYGAPTRAPLRKHLSRDWETLRILIDDEPKFTRGLSRLIHWASRLDIEPSDINDEVLERFRADIDLRTFRSNSRNIHRQTCKLWNDAGDRFTGWPSVRLTVPWYRRQISLPWLDFPQGFRDDIDAYVRFMSGADILAEDVPTPRRASTLESHRGHFRRFASALVHSGVPIDKITSLAVLTEPDNVRGALRYYEQWLNDDLRKHPSVFEMVSSLTVMARDYHKVPEPHLDVLLKLRARLRNRKRGFTEKNRERLRPLRDPAVQARFLSLSELLLKQARGMKRPHRQALLVQQALAHELMLIAPMRIKNLVSLHLEKNIRWSGDERHPRAYLIFQPDEVKNGEYLDFDLPEPLAHQLKEYRDIYRPRLISGQDHGWLFPGAGSSTTHKHKVTLSEQLCGAVANHVGIVMNMHLYRHIAAFFYLQEHPGEYEVVRRLLGHKSIETTTMFYTEFEGIAARRLFATLLQDRKDKARAQISELQQ